jgi:hypothetical protein
MHRKLALAFAVSVLACLALATPSFAHNLSVSPTAGFPGTDFIFRGTLWQPFQRVRWYYDELNDGDFQQSGSFIVGRSGNFTFRWRGEDTAGTHRLCFRQFDSRSRFRTTFVKCRRFTALPD